MFDGAWGDCRGCWLSSLGLRSFEGSSASSLLRGFSLGHESTLATGAEDLGSTVDESCMPGHLLRRDLEVLRRRKEWVQGSKFRVLRGSLCT